jgi:hypothetical protein
MSRNRHLTGSALTSLFLLAIIAAPAPAYIGGPPATLGMMCNWSTHVIQVRIERVDKEKGIIVWRKLHDYKGKWPGGEVIRQNLAACPERAAILQWADEGKTTVIFALESYKWSHTYIDKLWYASVTTDWQTWSSQHVEPVVLRTYAGRTSKLQGAVAAILAGNDVVVPCMADDAKLLAQRRAKIQQFRASLKRLDYNAGRDFVSWGGDDFESLLGMPGFTQSTVLGRIGADARGISFADFDGDGKLNICLSGASRTAVLQNSGGLMEVSIPGIGDGCRAAVWADYNDDGLPDLLLATVKGPKLFTNLGKGQFRDDSHLLPQEPAYDLTTAAWIDYDGDGRPDILLANGFRGLCLYRNKGKADPLPPAKPGQIISPAEANRWFEDASAAVGLGPTGVGSDGKGDTLITCDVNGDGRTDFLYGAGSGLLVLNTPKGFVIAKDCGISFRASKVAPAFADFDNSGAMSLFVPQLDGHSKLFKNDGKGHFADVTESAGDLASPMGVATCAAWGDFDGNGRPDLIVGCLKGPNRYFRNKGDGTFVDATDAVGFHKRIFNTRAVAVADLNQDGALDLVLHNEGQDSLALFGDPNRPRSRTPLTFELHGGPSSVGARIRVLDSGGKLVACRELGGGEGRGGQSVPQAIFALVPGAYRVETHFSSGMVRSRDVSVERSPLRIKPAEK